MRSWRGLRAWERHRKRWDADRATGLGHSPRFWDRLQGRALRPYNVGAVVTPHYSTIAGWRSPGACHAVLAVVCLAFQLDRRGRVLVGKLERIAQVTNLGRSTVQRALDDMVKSGDVERRHHFEPLPAAAEAGKVRHAQLECSYRPGPAMRARLRCAAKGRTPEAVHREQSTGSQPPPGVSSGVPGRAGGRASRKAPEGRIPAQVLRVLLKRGLLPSVARFATSPPAPNPLGESTASLPLSSAERRLAALREQGFEL